MTPEQHLEKLGIHLSEATPPVASYVNYTRSGNLVYLSGKGPLKPDGQAITGKLGKELNIEQGYEAARLAAIQHLNVLKTALGNLSKIKKIVKVFGMVNSIDTFTEQPKVINGYSDLMFAVFEEKGKHARSAVSVPSLPMNWAVEVEVIVEIEN